MRPPPTPRRMAGLAVGATLLASAADGAAAQQHDTCIVGGGLGGVQLAYFLEQAGRDYVVFEKGAGAGSFFRKYPRHRSLISINKRHTGRGGSALALEHNLRHDWHSLLSGVQSGDVQEDMLFANAMDDKMFYPAADTLAEYAEKWVSHYGLNVKVNSEVKQVRKASDGAGGFEVDVAETTGAYMYIEPPCACAS